MNRALVETLEARRLLSVAVGINFQPAGAAVPAGYLADTGVTFANRNNGYSYGWSLTNTSYTRDRNSPRSPDQRYDTLNFMQKTKSTNATWEIALPDGQYRVRIVAGDPASFDSTHKINAEGVLAVNGTPSSAQPWVEGSATVNVTDGRLTVTPASGAVNAKICFIDIESTDVPPPPPSGFAAKVNFQPGNAAVPNGYLADSGQVFGSRSGGLSFGWSADNTGTTRDRNSSLSLDQRYDTLAHLQKQSTAGVRWELVVPNGQYTVRLVAGDAFAYDSVFKIDVEGLLAINATPTSGNRWAEGSVVATVTDGRLTIKAASGAVNAKLCYVEVQAVATSALDQQIAHTLDFAKSQVQATLNEIGNNTAVYVERTQDKGNWRQVNAANWTSGFLPGVMWQLYQQSGDETWRTRATNWTLNLASQTTQDGDLAFRFMTTYKPLFDLTGNSTHRQVLLNAAAEKNSHWNATVGAFETTWFKTASGNPAANFAVLTDMTCDLELMFWAAAETGNQQYYDRAVAHMEKVISGNMRPDGSTAQFAMYDRNSGAFVMNETYQGYANNSTWSRGQAWAVMSFADVAKTTRRSDFLAAARKVADWWIAHVPADGVPFWDFDHPDIPSTYKDSSAAAIAVNGLLNLAEQLGTAGNTYRAAAEKVLTSLTSSAYLAEGTVHNGVLTHGAANVPKIVESRDASLIYGDYYLLKAINRWKSH